MLSLTSFSLFLSVGFTLLHTIYLLSRTPTTTCTVMICRVWCPSYLPAQQHVLRVRGDVGSDVILLFPSVWLTPLSSVSLQTLSCIFRRPCWPTLSALELLSVSFGETWSRLVIADLYLELLHHSIPFQSSPFHHSIPPFQSKHPTINQDQLGLHPSAVPYVAIAIILWILLMHTELWVLVTRTTSSLFGQQSSTAPSLEFRDRDSFSRRGASPTFSHLP